MGNLYLAAVAAALGIFALPAFFFGMITPYVIRLRIADVDTAGATVGRLYALSTAGSILGTFLGGFVLISFFGSTAILWGVALCMLLLSLCNAPARPRPRFLLLALCALLAWQDGLYGQWLAEKGGVRLVESPYNSIRIMEGVDRAQDGRTVRLMATDPGYSQSGMLLDAPDELYFDYTRFYALGPRHVPGARKVLMLGGGGYSVPKWLLSGKSGLDAARLRLTVVELDPAMTATSRRWFGLRDDPRLTVRHEDARAFLNRRNERYDLVFVDVFNSHYSVPFQMGTVEAAQGLRRAVAPVGALLMNVISAVEGPDGRLFGQWHHALAAAFAEVRVYCVGRPDRPGEVQNLMLLAFPEAVPDAAPPAADAAAGATDPPARKRTPCWRVTPGSYRRTPRALTDDFAPGGALRPDAAAAAVSSGAFRQAGNEAPASLKPSCGMPTICRLAFTEGGRAMENNNVKPVDITENVLTMLGRKMSSGRDLTMSERLMAMTATAQTTSNRYGPGPADMVVQQPELPETVKGVLANYTGV